MSDVGWAGSGCNPEYKDATIQFLEKHGKSVHGKYH